MRSEFSINSLRFFFKVFFGNYSVVAGRGIITSAIATGVLGFITTILFLFCIPELDAFFALDAPQPFVQLYALAFGKGPSIFMTIIAVIGLIMVRAFPPPYTVVTFLKSSPRSTNDPLPPFCVSPHRISEYQHRSGGRFATPLRCCARWRPSAIKLDRTRRQQSTTEECGDGHVCICSGAVVLHHTEPSRLHVPHIGWRRTDHRGLWAHRVAAPYVHSALFQVVAFLSRALGATHVRFDGVVQRARLCGALVYIVIFSFNNNGGFGGYYIGHDRPVLLPGNGQHVQLRLHHLWFSVDLRDPILVLHTCE